MAKDKKRVTKFGEPEGELGAFMRENVQNRQGVIGKGFGIAQNIGLMGLVAGEQAIGGLGAGLANTFGGAAQGKGGQPVQYQATPVGASGFVERVPQQPPPQPQPQPQSVAQPPTEAGTVNAYGDIAPTASPYEQNRLRQQQGENVYAPDYAQNNGIVNRGNYGGTSDIYQRKPTTLEEAKEFGSAGLFSNLGPKGTDFNQFNQDVAAKGQTFGFNPKYDNEAEAAVVAARRKATSDFLAANRQSLDARNAQRIANRRQRNLERAANKRVDLNEGLSEYFTNVSQRRYARDILNKQRETEAASALQTQKDDAAFGREGFKQENENARASAKNRTDIYKERMGGIRERLKSSAEALGGDAKDVSMARVETIMTGSANAYNAYAKENGLAPISADPSQWNPEVLSLMTALAENVFKSQRSGDKEDVDVILRRMLANRGT